MKKPKFHDANFRFQYKLHWYNVNFMQLNDKSTYQMTVRFDDEDNIDTIEQYRERVAANKTTALEYLCKALAVPHRNKISGTKKDALIPFKAVNSICPTAVEKNHNGLQKDIENILARYSKKWSHLKRREPNYIHTDEFNIDGDEYTAIICAGIYKNAPFADRIDFLSTFLERTQEQIKTLLFYHFTRYNAFIEDDYYQEIFVEFETHISLYFTKFYKPNYTYGH